ncbi:MAG: WGxxGxxG-CTERM domain-containing protein [Pseudomonadota bacterium]|nr:WGxxGxxG-CTERM domain-containing protein [Pseudomonadota bacterium]
MKLIIAASIGLAGLSPVAASAAAVSDANVTTIPYQEEENDFPWGLLGLIGLAGLLGRKRDDVHVDRRDPTDTTSPRP